ncbi:MAG: ABC transporter ATP-binding protein [Chitinophagales bacterium]
MIALRDLSIGFGTRIVIQHINLLLPSPCFMAVIGDNGTGKTTLMKTMAGLAKPLTGDIHWQSRNFNAMSAASRAEILSVVLTERQVPGQLTVRELIQLGAPRYIQLWQGLTEEDQNQVILIAKQLHLTALLDQPVMSISDGERQKAFIGRALMQNTPVILLDEPTAFLDVTNKRLIFALLRKMADSGKTIICATHDWYDVKQYATHFMQVNAQGVALVAPDAIDYLRS